jgi:recombinational DNA repair protein RecR
MPKIVVNHQMEKSISKRICRVLFTVQPCKQCGTILNENQSVCRDCEDVDVDETEEIAE